MHNYSKEKMRDYMRKRREGLRKGTIHPRSRHEIHASSNYVPIARNPIYDPARDGALKYENITAEVFGDPPIGRRAIDRGMMLYDTIHPVTVECDEEEAIIEERNDALQSA